MFFIFLIEDPPTWVILMTSKLDLWLRVAGCLQYPFVQQKTNSDSYHLTVFGMDSITMYFLFMLRFQFRVEFFQVEFCCLYLILYSDSIFWFQQMILKEENNQEKILTDGVLDVNHEQENMPSANGKASSWSRSLSGSRLTIQSVWGCWDLSPMHHVGLSGPEGPVSSQSP